MRSILACLLVVEALATGMRALSRLQVLMIYPWDTLALMGLRLGVALVQFAGGSAVLSARDSGQTIAQWAYILSAVLVTVELGFGLAPTNLFPAYRWPAVGFYWLYALFGFSWIRWRMRRSDEGQ